MKKHYSILWIDDEEDSIRTPKKEITQHLKEIGIVAKITYSNPTAWTKGYSSDADVLQCLEDPELDMVLMDYNLGDSYGKEVIALLREQNIFVPVIYYSQQHFKDLQKSLNEENVDGVFVTHRDNLEDKTKRILNSLLNKEHKVRRMRGLLLSDASELEAQGAYIAERCWNLLEEQQKANVRKKFKKYLTNCFKRQMCVLETINFEFNDINAFWNQRILDANKRGYLLQKIVQQLGWKDHVSNINNLCGDEQPVHIFSVRNKFAHQTEKQLQASINEMEGVNFPKEIRDELHKYEKNKQDLLDAIKKQELLKATIEQES